MKQRSVFSWRYALTALPVKVAFIALLLAACFAAHQLRATSVAGSCFPAAASGIVPLEPFGGLSAGLETALRNETAVKQYYHMDSNASSCAIAACHIQQLPAQHSLLLSETAVKHAFAPPQDVEQVETKCLIAAGASTPKHPWLVVAGWPLQDLLQAGLSNRAQG